MTVIRPTPRLDSSPRPQALAGAAALHVGVFALGVLILHLSHPLRMGPSVAVTLVAQGPENLRPADPAPEPVEAATPDPVPEAPKMAVAQPLPVPPVPSPAKTVQSAKTASPKAAAPSPTGTTAAKPGLDLNALAAQLSARAGAGRIASSAPKGPARNAAAVVTTPAVGDATGVTASALSAMSTELNKRWSPNCEVEGGADVNVKITFRLGAGGQVVGTPTSSAQGAADPIVRAASDRAIRAVNDASPFDTLPPELFGQTFSVNFDARRACA